MLLLNKISLIVLFFSSFSFAQNNEEFRTPAKLYAGAYTIKLQVKKDWTEYDIPVWIKPDQAESTIDAVLLKELGYVDKTIFFQEVKISGELLEKKKFKNLHSEWAFVPDFAKSCCYGVIGRDILEDFQIRFDPKSPTHLEWTRIITKDKLPPYPAPFLTELKKLFSLNQTLDVPFVLNLQERTLKWEGVPAKAAPSLFSFFFVPPERFIKVTSILPKDAPAAKKVGFTSGLIITEINGEKVNELDRWQVEKYLRGEKTPFLKIATKQKKEFNFDFAKREFN